MYVMYVCMYVRDIDTDKDTRVEKKYIVSPSFSLVLFLHF